MATNSIFSRLYRGLTQRSRLERLERANKQLAEHNEQLQKMLARRDDELERLNGILATIDQGIIMQDVHGDLLHINDGARRLLGGIEAFEESELSRLFEAYRDVDELDSELVPLSEPARMQINNRIVGAQLAAIADSQGKRIGTLIVLRDVTEEALGNRLKDQFVTAISHELRTPMTVIKGASDVLSSALGDEPPQRRMLETLGRNVDVLDRMVVELLDISEMTSGTFTIRRDPVDLEALAWTVIGGMQPELKKKRLDVAVWARDLDRIQLHGDDQRLRWALGHLVQNSINYTEPDGRIILTLGLNADQQIAIQVIDTGVGIAEKDLPRIFERFYRGEPRTPDGKLLDPRGLGQGLFVANTVAEAHGGHLQVNSTSGQGSIFTLVLPAA